MAEPGRGEIGSSAEGPREIDGYALASFVIGTISLFSLDRFSLQFLTGFFNITLVLLVPVIGLVTASMGRNRITSGADLRGRTRASSGLQLALAGAVLSGLSLVVLILSAVFGDAHEMLRITG